MAEVIREVPVDAVEVGGGWLGARPRVSWGAVFAGAFSALGLWLLLYVFGLAIGLSTIDTSRAGSLKSSGMFTGIWGLVAPILALFVGGLVSGRLSGTFARGLGGAHGLVVWGLTAAAGAVVVVMALMAVLSGAASVTKAVAEVGGSAVGSAIKGVAGAGAAADWFGLDADDALGPVNQRLQAEGKPPITADQLKLATRDAVQTGVREGRFDRESVTAAVARNTGLSQADAQEIAGRLESQFDRAKGSATTRLKGAAETAKTGALKAAESSGKAFWVAFGALLLGLVAAVAGGILGVPGTRTFRRERERVVAGTARPLGPPREVYP
jgi:hypothetical protein